MLETKTMRRVYEVSTPAGPAHIRLHQRHGDWCINDIYVPPRARGMGTARALMDRVLEDADYYGITLVLYIVPSGGWYGLSYAQLQDWYERCGFWAVGEPTHYYRREPQ